MDGRWVRERFTSIAWSLWLASTLGVVACDALSAATDERRECSQQQDCEFGQRCAPAPRVKRASGLEDIVVPACEPCSLMSCPGGYACYTPPGEYCGECRIDCNVNDSCTALEQCAATGECVPLPCTDMRHPGCPQGMKCDADYDPAASLTGPPAGTAPPYALTDAALMSLYAQEFSASFTGCVYKDCDEPGARLCASGYRCDPQSPNAYGTGCEPVPCAELGRCSTIDFICEPTSDHQRPDGVDAHGCVRRNCEEGFVCPGLQACSPEDPRAGVTGCVAPRCDELGGAVCDPSQSRGCDPTRTSDPTGCVPWACREPGYTCLLGLICNPIAPNPDDDGCVPQSLAPAPGQLTSQPVTAQSCFLSGDCQTGFCVNGFCASAPGVCERP